MSDFNSAEYVQQKKNDSVSATNPSRYNAYNSFNHSESNNNNNSSYAKRRNDERNTYNSSGNSQQITGYKSPTFNAYNNNSRQSTHFSETGHSSWCGRLPPKIYATSSVYSRKVFLGGLPWDVNQSFLVHMLQAFGQVKLEIPGKDLKHPRVSTKTQERNTPGYVYIIYENESSVQRLLAQCRKEMKNGGEHFYFNITIPTFSNNGGGNNNCSMNGGNGFRQNQMGGRNNMHNNNGTVTGVKTKEVEVIPWNQVNFNILEFNAFLFCLAFSNFITF